MGGACVTRSATRICIGPSPCAPLADDIGLVADGTPYADAADVLTGFGAAEIVAPPFPSLRGHSAPQFTANPLHIDGLSLVGEGGIAGDHKEPTDAAKRGDDLLDHLPVTIAALFAP